MQHASTWDVFLLWMTATSAVVFDIAAQLRSATAFSFCVGIFQAQTTDFVPCIVPSAIVAPRGSAAIGWRWWPLTGPYFSIVTVTAGRSVVERPTRRRVLTFVGLAGAAAPAFTGVIDLALGARTP